SCQPGSQIFKGATEGATPMETGGNRLRKRFRRSNPRTGSTKFGESDFAQHDRLDPVNRMKFASAGAAHGRASQNRLFTGGGFYEETGSHRTIDSGTCDRTPAA